ncbi:MAG TPA: response regulator [Kofleriaceae bacterium]
MEESLSILVVEDDPVYAEFVASTLRAAGHDLSVAHTGASARERARTERPHAVILDLGLPDESGYEVARALRAGVLDDAAVIILLTANPSPQLDMAEAVGIDIVLGKPVEPTLVSAMIDHVRSRRQRRLQLRR